MHICNNFIFIFNLEKVQSYRHNNLIQTGKVNANLCQIVTNSDKNSVIVASRFFAQSHQKDLITKSAFFC